ncbi:hypothetical protein D3C73_1177760 [compost metagenome]
MAKKKKPGLVSSLSMQFKKAVTVSDDMEQVKKEHRGRLANLVEDYMDKVAEGTVDGIRNAKDLVEVIKMDLLLGGEVTDRTENNIDEARVSKIAGAIDVNDPAMAQIMQDFFDRLNESNDEAEDTPDLDEEE